METGDHIHKQFQAINLNEDKKSLLGITAKKEDNFHVWYIECITKAEMIEYYDISGCYILRPWAYSIWEHIQSYLDGKLKSSGVQNAYFPLLVSKNALTKEKDHIEGFAPEVAWITKAGSSDLSEPLAIRPTSETIMYPFFSKWIRSHKDLPMRLNQWCNVVRWEFKHPVPFLRTREFLWQEGHSAFSTRLEAENEVREILELYRETLEDILAIPVIVGRKSENEKFAGALYTTTCEAFIPASGRGIQAATSHCLGQNFSKMFDITYESGPGSKELVWQNSWGITTRIIGIMTMIHGDDKGLILPPKVAPIQVVIVPIHPPKGKGNYTEIVDTAHKIEKELTKLGLRVYVDDRNHLTAPSKYNYSELKGIPIRLEYGLRDHENKQVTIYVRFTGKKSVIPLDMLNNLIPEILDCIHRDMLDKAKTVTSMVPIKEWDDFMPTLNNKNIVLAPWCEEPSCEDEIKQRSSELSKTGQSQLSGSVKSLCIPFNQPKLDYGTQCFYCKKPAKSWCLFGRSY